MFNIFEELTWPQFSHLPDVAKLSINEQVQHYNQYLYDLSVSRQNWLETQPKGSTTTEVNSITLQVEVEFNGDLAEIKFESENGLTDLTFDWGDGSALETFTLEPGNIEPYQHTYSFSGIYNIVVTFSTVEYIASIIVDINN
jgi:hypothetical protein